MEWCAWNASVVLCYYVMENGGNTVEAGASSCPVFTEPKGREEGPMGLGQLQFLPWEWPVLT